MTQQIDVNQLADALNAKVDLDGTWGFPSSQYDDLTLGADGATYTAPASGYFVCGGTSSASGQPLQLSGQNTRLNNRVVSSGNGQMLRIFVPAKMGDVVGMNYGTTSNNWIVFIYAQKTN